MANRVLKRPMFRMGGSPNFEFQEKTSGILSGLDGPKLSASRTGYENGGLTMEDFKKDVLNQAEMRREIYGDRMEEFEDVLALQAGVVSTGGATTDEESSSSSSVKFVSKAPAPRATRIFCIMSISVEIDEILVDISLSLSGLCVASSSS